MVQYQQDIYDIVRLIPKGKVTTYGRIADYLALGSARMVGWAMNKSHLTDPTIPAHRVVNRKGELTGRLHFVTPDYMQELLEKEGLTINNDCIVDFEKHVWSPEEIDV